MGTVIRIILFAPDAESADKAFNAAFDEFAALDEALSDYRAESELSRLSAAAGQGPQKISDTMFTILGRSGEFARLSEGTFDPTVGPLVRLWRKARKDGKLPDKDELAVDVHVSC